MSGEYGKKHIILMHKLVISQIAAALKKIFHKATNKLEGIEEVYELNVKAILKKDSNKLTKIFDRILIEVIRLHLHENKFTDRNNHGGKARHSTITCLTEMLLDIANELGAKPKNVVIFC